MLHRNTTARLRWLWRGGGGAIFSLKSKARPINLALQGGGVHGAFTWGVLERVLLDETLSPRWISGTSAGAVNAVAIAHGLANGGPIAAVETLQKLWQGVVEAQVPDLVKINPFMAGLVRSASVPQGGQVLSPYEFNPMGFDPFRRLLERHIDFEKIVATRPCELLIAATDVETGLPRLFRTEELTVDVVLASACLPVLHHAVIIDGHAYWDGGYSANPDLVNLLRLSRISDTLIVQLNPTRIPMPPRTLRQISDRAETVAFNQSYLNAIRELVRLRDLPGNGRGTGDSLVARVKRHRFHLIEAGRHTASLDQSTKVQANNALVEYLRSAGSGEAHKWLERHGAKIGKSSSVELKAHFGI
ncbi:MAG: patatin-like phospholipase family protein [Pseudomonadota bacterium]